MDYLGFLALKDLRNYITVCPSKDSSLNLNYDIIQANGIKVDEKERSEILDYALEVIQYEFYICRNHGKSEQS